MALVRALSGTEGCLINILIQRANPGSQGIILGLNREIPATLRSVTTQY